MPKLLLSTDRQCIIKYFVWFMVFKVKWFQSLLQNILNSLLRNIFHTYGLYYKCVFKNKIYLKVSLLKLDSWLVNVHYIIICFSIRYFASLNTNKQFPYYKRLFRIVCWKWGWHFTTTLHNSTTASFVHHIH